MAYVKRDKFQLQAMKNHKKSNWFLHEFILYSLTALVCSLFCYHPYWFPSMCSFIQKLPYIWSCFFTPKCLFIVANVIVVFLFGESIFLGSSSSSSSNSSYNPASQYYEEYVDRSRRARASSSSSSSSSSSASVSITSTSNTHQERKPEMGLTTHEVKKVTIKEEDQEVAKTKVDQVKKDIDDHEEEEEAGLPTEELNKRAEEFIARVNKQRRLEARSLACCQARAQTTNHNGVNKS